MKVYGFIYKTICIVNGKIYIGQHVGSLSDGYLGSGTYFTIALKKYGRENFKRKILKVCFSQKELSHWEQVMISKYRSTDKSIGYNIAEGDVNTSEYNPAKLPEVIEKMTKKNRETTSNAEYRKKQSEIMKEYFKTHDGTFTGKKHSEETKRKISEKAKGRVGYNKGGHVSEEQKRKQSDKMKGRYNGEKNPNYGNHWSEEQRKSLSEKKKKAYKGRKWINNGEIEKFVELVDNVIPDGYKLGRIHR